MSMDTLPGVYRATVVDNADPEGRGRLRLRVPKVTGTKAVTQWCWPSMPLTTSPAALPAINSGVWVLYENGSANHPVWIGGFGGDTGDTASAGSRRTSTYTTGALSAGMPETGRIRLAKGFRLLEIETSIAARVRLYGTVSDRDADVVRGAATQPAAGVSVVLDYLTSTMLLHARLSPLAEGASLEESPSSLIPITVTPTTSGSVTVTLTWIRTE